MPTVPEQLRQARETRKLTVSQVAETTKIRSDYITALETGDYGVFSAPVYVRGFARTYSNLLKLDTAAILAQLDQELRQTEKLSEAPKLTPAGGGITDRIMLFITRMELRKSGLAILVLAVVLGAMVLFMVVQRQRTRDPLEGLGQITYQQTNQPFVNDTLPLDASK